MVTAEEDVDGELKLSNNVDLCKINPPLLQLIILGKFKYKPELFYECLH